MAGARGQGNLPHSLQFPSSLQAHTKVETKLSNRGYVDATQEASAREQRTGEG